jgi:glycosyltransferase involved in cell wall biosynthesis
MPFVSIIIPVKNEESILDRCLEAIDCLAYPKDRLEVIVADGLSTDRSREIAEAHGAKVVPNERRTVASGRNRGFERAQGEFIAFTDADCVAGPEWLKTGIGAFQMGAAIAGVGGVTRFPEDATAFQKAVNMLFSLAGIAGFTAHLEEVASTRLVADIPGCNAIYRRSALEKVMPIDERLLTGEDIWMNWLLRQQGFEHVVSRHMVLWHYRRNRPGSFLRQVYRFAIGRLQVGKRARSLLRPVHVLAGISLPLVLGTAVLAIVSGHPGALLATALVACLVPALVGLVKTRSLQAGLWTPLVLAIFLTGWSGGFLRELMFPLRSADGK